eukprot:SAG31_NODE_4_length_45662_cov_15.654622_14_plen_514_part_00
MFEKPEWFKSMGVKGVPFFIAGEIIVWTVNILILISTFAFCFETLDILSTDPNKNYNANPDVYDYEEFKVIWMSIEIVCVLAFSIDFGVRMVCSILIGMWAQFRTDPMNLIDIVAILPFYVSVAVAATGADYSVPDFRFMRVIRLARILRSLPEKYAGLGTVVVDIVKFSAAALFLPLFFMMLFLMVCAAVTMLTEKTHKMKCMLELDGESSLYYILPFEHSYAAQNYDHGKYAESLHGPTGSQIPGGLRALGLEPCTIEGAVYNEEFDADENGLINEDDVKLARDHYTEHGDVAICPCPGTIFFISRDGTESSSANFDTMGDSMWWVVTTFTTVGYGDFNPQRFWGQLCAAITMFVGIFFLAMPLAIVGNAFATAWAKAQAKDEELKSQQDPTAVGKVRKMRNSMLSTRDYQLIKSMTHEAIGQVDLTALLFSITQAVTTIVDRCDDAHLHNVKSKISDFVEQISALQHQIERIEVHETAADRKEAAERERQEQLALLEAEAEEEEEIESEQ